MSNRRVTCLAGLIVAPAVAVGLTVGPALALPATVLAEAGDSCGAVAPGTVTVAAGSMSCADAMVVVNRYLTDPSAEHDGDWVRFDGWECWAPTADQKFFNGGFNAECSRGADDIQLRP